MSKLHATIVKCSDFNIKSAESVKIQGYSLTYPQKVDDNRIFVTGYRKHSTMYCNVVDFHLCL